MKEVADCEVAISKRKAEICAGIEAAKKRQRTADEKRSTLEAAAERLEKIDRERAAAEAEAAALLESAD